MKTLIQYTTATEDPKLLEMIEQSKQLIGKSFLSRESVDLQNKLEAYIKVKDNGLNKRFLAKVKDNGLNNRFLALVIHDQLNGSYPESEECFLSWIKQGKNEGFAKMNFVKDFVDQCI